MTILVAKVGGSTWVGCKMANKGLWETFKWENYSIDAVVEVVDKQVKVFGTPDEAA